MLHACVGVTGGSRVPRERDDARGSVRDRRRAIDAGSCRRRIGHRVGIVFGRIAPTKVRSCLTCDLACRHLPVLVACVDIRSAPNLGDLARTTAKRRLRGPATDVPDARAAASARQAVSFSPPRTELFQCGPCRSAAFMEGLIHAKPVSTCDHRRSEPERRTFSRSQLYGAREAQVRGVISAAALEAGLTSAERRCNAAKR